MHDTSYLQTCSQFLQLLSLFFAIMFKQVFGGIHQPLYVVGNVGIDGRTVIVVEFVRHYPDLMIV